MASCDKPDSEIPQTPVEITFSGGATRSMEQLSHDYRMYVTSIHHNPTASTSNYYLENALFAWNGTAWAGNNGRHYYYPLSGTMDFVALALKAGDHIPLMGYTPSKQGTLSADQSFTQVVFDYTSDGRKLNGSEDQLVSVGTNDIECNSSNAAPVQLQFAHLLTNVRFKFSAETYEASQFFTVTDVIFLKTHMSGVATVKKTGNVWGIEWSSLTPAERFAREVSINPVFGSDDLPYTDFYLPQQDTAEAKFMIYFRYRVEGDIYTEKMWYLTSNFPTPATWIHGNRYTYIVNCKMLPHVEFRVELVNEAGFVIDSWVVEPQIEI